MTDRPSPLSDLDLHAYVDDRLDGARRAEVEALLGTIQQERDRAEAERAAAESSRHELEETQARWMRKGHYRGRRGVLCVLKKMQMFTGLHS